MSDGRTRLPPVIQYAAATIKIPKKARTFIKVPREDPCRVVRVGWLTRTVAAGTEGGGWRFWYESTCEVRSGWRCRCGDPSREGSPLLHSFRSRNRILLLRRGDSGRPSFSTTVSRSRIGFGPKAIKNIARMLPGVDRRDSTNHPQTSSTLGMRSVLNRSQTATWVQKATVKL